MFFKSLLIHLSFGIFRILIQTLFLYFFFFFLHFILNIFKTKNCVSRIKLNRTYFEKKLVVTRACTAWTVWDRTVQDHPDGPKFLSDQIMDGPGP